jgi:hypothetical protein
LRLNIFDKNRRRIGKSQSTRPPERTPRPPHPQCAGGPASPASCAAGGGDDVTMGQQLFAGRRQLRVGGGSVCTGGGTPAPPARYAVGRLPPSGPRAINTRGGGPRPPTHVAQGRVDVGEGRPPLVQPLRVVRPPSLREAAAAAAAGSARPCTATPSGGTARRRNRRRRRRRRRSIGSLWLSRRRRRLRVLGRGAGLRVSQSPRRAIIG